MSGDILVHYGVKGMKWGVRKERRAIRRESAAQKFERKAQKAGDKAESVSRSAAESLAKGKRRAAKAFQKRYDDLVKEKATYEKSAEAKRSGKLTPGQKKVLIGASVVAGLVAVNLGYNYVDSGAMTRHIDLGKSFLGYETAFKKKSELAGTKTVDEIMRDVIRGVNPKYGQPGSKMNCRRCTFTYEMRRRGYDVQATRSTKGVGQTGLGLAYSVTPGKKGPTGIFPALNELMKPSFGKESLLDDFAGFSGSKSSISLEGITGSKDPKSFGAQAIFKSLSKEPDGSRGELGLGWSLGAGHSVAYEIIGGKPIIFDAQSGKKAEKIEDFIKIFPTVSSAGYTRLDNIELNEDFLKKWVKNAR